MRGGSKKKTFCLKKELEDLAAHTKHKLVKERCKRMIKLDEMEARIEARKAGLKVKHL